jgi:hypothetical protein
MPDNSAIIAKLLDPDNYQYLLTPQLLLKSENASITRTIAINHNLNHVLDKFILSNPANQRDNLQQLNHDYAREVRIDNLPYQQNVPMPDAEFREFIVATFGEENITHFLAHYSQKLSYLAILPAKEIFVESLSDLDAIGVKKNPEHTENIFSIDDALLREVTTEYLYVSVPQDKGFRLDDYTQMLQQEDQEFNAMNQEKLSEEELISLKNDRVNNYNGIWKFKSSTKILARSTAEGFEILGIATDSALAANMIMNSGEPAGQLKKLVETILEFQKQVTAKKLELVGNLYSAATDASVMNLTEKEKYINLISNAISDFKNGVITFDNFVKGVQEVYVKAKAVEPRGIMRNAINMFMLFSRQEKVDSPTSAMIKGFATKLEGIQKDMRQAAEVGVNPRNDPAPIVSKMYP